jgi:hypothetical protein
MMLDPESCKISKNSLFFSLLSRNCPSGFSLPAMMRNRASMSAARIVADICLGRASALLVEATRGARRYHHLGAKIAVRARLAGEAARLLLL